MKRDTKKTSVRRSHSQPKSEKAAGSQHSSSKKRQGAIRAEHYRGERIPEELLDAEGDVNEETLDQDAPYNRTYGTEREPQ